MPVSKGKVQPTLDSTGSVETQDMLPSPSSLVVCKPSRVVAGGRREDMSCYSTIVNRRHTCVRAKVNMQLNRLSTRRRTAQHESQYVQGRGKSGGKAMLSSSSLASGTLIDTELGPTSHSIRVELRA
jgi:hypothetical protein